MQGTQFDCTRSVGDPRSAHVQDRLHQQMAMMAACLLRNAGNITIK